MIAGIVDGAGSLLPALEVLGPAALKAVAVLGLAWAVTRLAFRRSAALRHLVWLVALAGCLALPVAEASLPSDLRMDARPLAGALAEGLRQVIGLADAPAGVRGAPAAAGERPAGGSGGTIPAVASSGEEGILGADSLRTAGEALLLVWLAGALVVLLRTVWGHLRLASIRRRARQVDGRQELPAACLTGIAPGELPEIRVSPEISLPVVQGLRRPALLLPQQALDEWPAERTAAVLLHEVGHVRRRDVGAHLLGRLACALYWFNPLVWWAAREARREQERACDDAVLRAGHRPSSYARHLLAIARDGVGGAVPAGLSMARWPDLEGRVLALLEEDADRRPIRRGSLAGIAVPALAVVFVLGAVTVGEPRGTTAGNPAAASDDGTQAPDGAPAAERDREPAGGPATAEEGERARLIAALESPSARVRKDAAHELGERETAAAIPALERVLRADPDPHVRKAAAWAIGETETARGADVLAAALREEPGGKLHRRLLRALGETEQPSAVPRLEEALESDDRRLRWTALEALVENGTPAARALLDRVLEGEDADLREMARRVLEEKEAREHRRKDRKLGDGDEIREKDRDGDVGGKDRRAKDHRGTFDP